MPLVGSPMANRLWVTAQSLHEVQKNQGTWRCPVQWNRGPTLEPGLGSGCSSEDLAGPSSNERRETIPQWAYHLQGGTMRDRCKENRAADEGGDLDDLISRC
ncbi:hypothetical protein ILYODFUR_031525 [Ilyodon furcidens]|uniref:Uncharacterized protein n=1 Tax=Ilyodon furcidens TaxID=33524 RepID=A0ABV0TCK3_9TELE